MGGYHSQLGHVTPGVKPGYKITLHTAAGRKEAYTPIRTPSAMSEMTEKPQKVFARNSSAMLKKPKDQLGKAKNDPNLAAGYDLYLKQDMGPKRA